MNGCRRDVLEQPIPKECFEHFGRRYIALVAPWLLMERRILFQVAIGQNRERQRLLFGGKVSPFANLISALGENQFGLALLRPDGFTHPLAVSEVLDAPGVPSFIEAHMFNPPFLSHSV